MDRRPRAGRRGRGRRARRGLPRPRRPRWPRGRRCAAWSSEIRAATGITCSIGIGPNKLVAKVASDAEKPAGFVVLTREAACERFARRSAALLPGIGAKTAERLEGMGIAHHRRARGRREADLAERFGAAPRPLPAPPRALRGRLARLRRAHRGVRVARDDVPDRHRRPRRAGAVLERLAGELCAGPRQRTAAAGGRSPSRSGSTTSRRSRGRGRCPRRPTRRRLVAGVARTLLREYAPPRPVRLLGVRVATFEHDAPPPEEEDAGQLALPL